MSLEEDLKKIAEANRSTTVHGLNVEKTCGRALESIKSMNDMIEMFQGLLYRCYPFIKTADRNDVGGAAPLRDCLKGLGFHEDERWKHCLHRLPHGLNEETWMCYIDSPKLTEEQEAAAGEWLKQTREWLLKDGG